MDVILRLSSVRWRRKRERERSVESKCRYEKTGGSHFEELFCNYFNLLKVLWNHHLQLILSPISILCLWLWKAFGIMKLWIIWLCVLSQVLLGCIALEFDTFTGMRCDTCGIMCGKFCGNRVFKACCYSHNKRSSFTPSLQIRNEPNGKLLLIVKIGFVCSFIDHFYKIINRFFQFDCVRFVSTWWFKESDPLIQNVARLLSLASHMLQSSQQARDSEISTAFNPKVWLQKQQDHSPVSIGDRLNDELLFNPKSASSTSLS